ncbi:Oidioi.mRNA.OKI2018_I69.chr2.g7170.t1.cds [Oikopleura dioica]|uniref:Oidioi.mRNA.OKI2018_I69.chr2.g7170.t1.cds n=1 Tax=Oikopleura dioica TaxID=34765 RepID=A0ABN7T6A7_OIKDI|nr:Oidioi.mRNA.OKI2018_I69.chr2.g7170.t1.cds [Oikopleura dioica]
MPTFRVALHQQTSCLNSSDSQGLDAKFIIPFGRPYTTIYQEIFNNTFCFSTKEAYHEIKEKSYFAKYCQLLSEKESVIKENEKEIEKLKNQNERHGSENRNHCRKIIEFYRREETLKNEIRELQDIDATHLMELSALNGKAIQREKRLNDEVFHLLSIERQQEKTIQEFSGKCAALRNEIKNLQQSISRKTNKNTELSKKLESEKKSTRDASQKIKEYHQLVQVLEDECHQARETNLQLLAEIKEENSKLKKENQGLSRALTRKHQQLESANSELEISAKRQKESEDEIASLMQLLQKNQNDEVFEAPLSRDPLQRKKKLHQHLPAALSGSSHWLSADQRLCHSQNSDNPTPSSSTPNIQQAKSEIS